MKAIFKSVVARLLAVLLTAPAAFAQDRPAFRQEELDPMLAPIALYPDPLLSQVLMASTYPLEVVQAARWSRSNPHLKGQDAVRAVEPMDWDPSVKSLVAFPQILHKMDEQLDWTQRLGEAFLAQEPHVMDAIQGLRQRAAAAGNLRSNEKMQVARQDEHILIEPAHPQVVYVPYYDPAVVYGPWWWPAYPPVFWGPPPGYYAAPVYAPAFIWGGGIVIFPGFFFGHFDWPRRHVTVVHVHYHHHPAHAERVHAAWRHDLAHRRGVPLRNAEARQRFEQSRALDARRDPDSSDRARLARRDDDNRPSDIRQRRWDERREAARERREPAGNRYTPNNDERVRPAVQPEVRFTLPDRNVRPERLVPQVNDRRGERKEAPRPQVRGFQPQSTVVAPVVRSEPRAAAAAPAIRAEARQAFEGGGRAEAPHNGSPLRATPPQRNVAQERAPAPRPAASISKHAPRAASIQPRDERGARAQGNGNPERRQLNGRDNNRKS